MEEEKWIRLEKKDSGKKLKVKKSNLNNPYDADRSESSPNQSSISPSSMMVSENKSSEFSIKL